jgi:FixJ family two-component response regulator
MRVGMKRLQQLPKMIAESNDRGVVLVVDDDDHIQQMLRMELEQAGYRVDVAGDGQKALTKARERRYDVALVDLRMPKMGGLELLRYLRSFTPDTAVVLFTALGSIGESVQAMKLGAVDFIEKPCEPSKILALLEEIFLRRRPDDAKTVADLLYLAELALSRKAWVEARTYAKYAFLRAPDRPEPAYMLGMICEAEGDVSLAPSYYYIALDVDHRFGPARDALMRLGRVRED